MKEITLSVPLSYHSTNLRGAQPYIHEDGEFRTEAEVSLRSCQTMADHWINIILIKHGVTMEDVTFLPEDTIEHANTQGLPCYMFHTEDGTGTHTYHLSTTFIK